MAVIMITPLYIQHAVLLQNYYYKYSQILVHDVLKKTTLMTYSPFPLAVPPSHSDLNLTFFSNPPAHMTPLNIQTFN